MLTTQTMKLKFRTQGPKYRDSICLVLPPFPKCQIKRHGEGREKIFITHLGTCQGRGRVSTHFIFSHLSGTDMSYRFNLKKELGTGDKGMHKQSQSQVCSGWPLPQFEGSREDVMAVIT
jgi:hypothetical protein